MKKVLTSVAAKPTSVLVVVCILHAIGDSG